MKSIVLVLLLACIHTSMSAPSPGIAVDVYSRNGLEHHYKNVFSQSGQTFGSQTMGDQSDSWSWMWWGFGTSMALSSLRVENFTMGAVTASQYNPQDGSYTFGIGETTGTFKYTWTYWVTVVPVFHYADCKFTLKEHQMTQKFTKDGEKFKIDRDFLFTNGNPTLDCTDGDSTQSSHWKYEWMKQVRDEYTKDLDKSWKKALLAWIDKSDTINSSVSTATLNGLTFTLDSHMKDSSSSANENYIHATNFDIKLNGKQYSPVPSTEVPAFETKNEMSTYYFEEYFQSMIKLIKETTKINVSVNDKTLPDGIQFRLKAKDFLYVIEGMSKFDLATDLSVSCKYGDKDIDLKIANMITVKIPMSCQIYAASTFIVDTSFYMQVVFTPDITATGILHSRLETYTIGDFTYTNKIGEKVLSDYVIRRLISYLTITNPIGQIQYTDPSLPNLTNISAIAGNHFLQITGDRKNPE